MFIVSEKVKRFIRKGLKEGVTEEEFRKMKKKLKLRFDLPTLSIRDKFGNLWMEVDKRSDKHIGGVFQIWKQNHKLKRVV